ncbi:hypothetical protein OOU_Y34scaffold00101g4 [Pyricularia oryzae Y34]|uniref:Uncharacterized protein n=1 Tax=Pyricularia oryzae (strain Y34) TaxID=1143189 RepID=A0AA97PRB5_PYRO3|nr:hypothetical protein OOU_Y34scaffold00101g4 [Pyricularia oryzae Y34]
MAGERGSDEAFVQFSAMADTLWLAMVAISTPPSWEAGSAVAAKCACIRYTEQMLRVLPYFGHVCNDHPLNIGLSGGELGTCPEFISFTCLGVQQECQRASSCHRVYKYEEFAATRPASQV